MDEHERGGADDPAAGWVEVERGIHFVDPDSELGPAMARFRAAWGEAGPPDPADFDEGSLRGTPVTD